jgi:hypothetical protein
VVVRREGPIEHVFGASIETRVPSVKPPRGRTQKPAPPPAASTSAGTCLLAPSRSIVISICEAGSPLVVPSPGSHHAPGALAGIVPARGRRCPCWQGWGLQGHASAGPRRTPTRAEITANARTGAVYADRRYGCSGEDPGAL